MTRHITPGRGRQAGVNLFPSGHLSAYSRTLITTLWTPHSAADGTLRPVHLKLARGQFSAAHIHDREEGMAADLHVPASVLGHLGVSFVQQGRMVLRDARGRPLTVSLDEYTRRPGEVLKRSDLAARLAAEEALASLWREVRALGHSNLLILHEAAQLRGNVVDVLRELHALQPGRHLLSCTNHPQREYTVYRGISPRSPVPLADGLARRLWKAAGQPPKGWSAVPDEATIRALSRQVLTTPSFQADLLREVFTTLWADANAHSTRRVALIPFVVRQ